MSILTYLGRDNGLGFLDTPVFLRCSSFYFSNFLGLLWKGGDFFVDMGLIPIVVVVDVPDVCRRRARRPPAAPCERERGGDDHGYYQNPGLYETTDYVQERQARQNGAGGKHAMMSFLSCCFFSSCRESWRKGWHIQEMKTMTNVV